MPIVTFDVESYTVSTHEQMQSTTGSYRTLALVSTALAHGIRTRATIFFFDTASATSGVVTNVDQPNFDGQRAYAYCRKPDFPGWYDLLRNEQPLKCTYAYDGAEFNANAPSRGLYWIQLYTGAAEPPGEGPEEVQGLKFPLSVLEVLHAGPRRADIQNEQ